VHPFRRGTDCIAHASSGLGRLSSGMKVLLLLDTGVSAYACGRAPRYRQVRNTDRERWCQELFAIPLSAVTHSRERKGGLLIERCGNLLVTFSMARARLLNGFKRAASDISQRTKNSRRAYQSERFFPSSWLAKLLEMPAFRAFFDSDQRQFLAF